MSYQLLANSDLDTPGPGPGSSRGPRKPARGNRSLAVVVAAAAVAALTGAGLLLLWTRLVCAAGLLAASPAPAQQAPPRILCAVLTTAENANKLEAVERTWARRCDKFLKVRRGEHLEESADGWLSVPLARESRDELWHKTLATFAHLYRRELPNFDWFLKADDDTYFLVDNLRRFLNESAPHEPVYYGHRFRPFVRQGYMSGGSGYVLSREALRRLHELGVARRLPDCDLESGSVEDVEMGKCLEAVGVRAGDTRDPEARETFLPLSPEWLLTERNADSWYWSYNYYGPSASSAAGSPAPARPFKDCCSNRPISFHYISARQMFFIDWLLNDVRQESKGDSRLG